MMNNNLTTVATSQVAAMKKINIKEIHANNLLVGQVAVSL